MDPEVLSNATTLWFLRSSCSAEHCCRKQLSNASGEGILQGLFPIALLCGSFLLLAASRS